jgi:phage regulator Rha-like protein
MKKQVYAITLSDSKHEQVIYVRGSFTVQYIGEFDNLEEEEKEMFVDNVAVFEPTSIN